MCIRTYEAQTSCFHRLQNILRPPKDTGCCTTYCYTCGMLPRKLIKKPRCKFRWQCNTQTDQWWHLQKQSFFLAIVLLSNFKHCHEFFVCHMFYPTDKTYQMCAWFVKMILCNLLLNNKLKLTYPVRQALKIIRR